MGKGDRRGGHNRKQGKRTSSGQLSRSATALAENQDREQRTQFEEGPTQTVLKARRMHRTPFKEPKRPEKWREKHDKPVSKQEVREKRLDAVGSVLGRLWADKHITDQQLAAGQDYCERYLRYSSLNGLPRVTPKIANYGEVTGGSRPDRIKAAIAAKAAHDADQRILRKCSAGTLWAMKRACVADEAAPIHLIREGLQALVANGR
ncbi:hypothetical protein ACRARG_04605 [Pseudooceanicola sp. C21-150M6]|uniref:hypothetical protein n=1 Tax=Pseudooceanicola sp. C21-150M6 TaxID=3434355 RepID=UPI003D7FC628